MKGTGMSKRIARLPRGWRAAGAGLASLAVAGATLAAVGSPHASADLGARASTPIQHVVVLFPENISFDHYFGTYPNALNDGTGPAFHAAAGTPIPDNYVSHPELLTA